MEPPLLQKQQQVVKSSAHVLTAHYKSAHGYQTNQGKRGHLIAAF